MKTLVRRIVTTAGLLMPVIAFGQALPPCPSGPVFTWNACIGEFRWPGGSRYLGAYQSGQQHGLGTLYSEAGQVLQTGRWSNGYFVGAGSQSGSSIVAASAAAGREEIKSSSLPPCRGESMRAWNDCIGEFRWPSGMRYEGGYRFGQQDGFGTLYAEDGTRLKVGRWESGSFIDDWSESEMMNLLKGAKGSPWRDVLERAVQSSLAKWLQPQAEELTEVSAPMFPEALSLKQDLWETGKEFEDRVEKARTERRQTIDRLQAEYRTKVEARNFRVAEYNKIRQEREASLPQRRRDLILMGIGILAPYVALSDVTLDQQSGALTVTAQVDGLGKQSFAFTETPQAFRRAALTERWTLRAKPEFEVSDAGEISLRAVSIEAGGATARGLPAVGAPPQLQLATVTLPQVQSAPVAQQSAVTVDRNQVEQILYREENESLRRRLEEQRRQQEQAVANAESRAAAEISRLKAEADVLRNQPSQSRLSPALAAVREAHALVIGNSAYPGSSRLANPVNDARAMAAKLRSLGFRVTEVPNATREQLVRGLSDFTRTAAKADLTLLFYAGHGVQIGGVNYMIPVDMSLTDPAQAPLQGVSLNSVVEQYMPGKAKLVFLDACRDNPLMASAGRGITKGLAPINVSEGTLIAYATKDGQVAEDGVGQSNSPFTSALLEHLADPDDIAVVLRTVRAKVMQRTNSRQQPWEYGSLTGGALVLSAIGAGPRVSDGSAVPTESQQQARPGVALSSGSNVPPVAQMVTVQGGSVTPPATGTTISFRTLRMGSGAAPLPGDTVRVHYRGTFPDGREFDSSYRRNQPAQFPLNRVIRCWTEGIQNMRAGGSASLVCPPGTAYGERGTPGGPIPPNATLHFEVELLEVVGR